MSDFEQSLRFGHKGEEMVALWAEIRGYLVSFPGRSGDPRFKTPSMARRERHRMEREAVADLQLARAGRSVNVEVKTKTKDVWYQKAGEWRQGIQRRLFDGYQHLQDESGLECFLAFVVLTPEPVKLRIQSVAMLDQHKRLGDMEYEPHVFWPIDIFETWRIDDDGAGGLIQMLPEPQPPNVHYAWDKPAPKTSVKQSYFDFAPPKPKTRAF